MLGLRDDFHFLNLPIDDLHLCYIKNSLKKHQSKGEKVDTFND
jgi:hypothetical protein